MKILITGAAGTIGSILVKGLRDRYQLRGFDRMPMPELEDAIVGELTDFEAVLKGTQGMEAVIHLGGNPSGAAPWEEILNSNIIGTYNLFEAARQHNVRRIAFASRAGLLAPYPENITRTVDMPPRPESYYSISKVFGENLGYMYASQHGMECVSVRIGNVRPDRPHAEHPHHLSHADAVRVFERAMIQPGVKYEVVFGVSGGDWPLYDLDHGCNVIGYEPGERGQE
ncbi:NAD(P)-dependent oxidoreductase [Chloroflexi bacterium TSY]|nr:NAD(P)-dependent oxidoreductase [Chloroflexi bacterium TSY]